ncbi:hypothetical protein E4U42_002264 [Claviceps africana]|uniref:Flavin-nucleotide-binding protein n=1 Tax=Claviceps africana TaxID=83212 RepID=A0A8K0JEG7_9HYPO|nr:hypothetical protein E4U42_002264 [Claviceps africana]
MAEQAFRKTLLNTVNRYRHRGVYDYETVHDIIDKTPILHISFSPSASGGGNGNENENEYENDTQSWYPVILPMLGCTGDFDNRDNAASSGAPRDIYLHGYVSSRLMRLASTHAADVSDQGMPVCVAATLLDGLVLALTPNHHSCNYRSVVAYGRAHVVTDEAERQWAMELIMDNMVPGRWAATRPPSRVEQRRTGILRVQVVSASAKVRVGTTGEERADLRDEAMRRRVWAGVVPAHLVWGEPVAAPTNLMEPTPRYIEEWRKRETLEAQEYARAVAK